MIVDSALYQNGVRTDGPDDISDLVDIAKRDGGFVWLGLSEPSHEEFNLVVGEFNFHPLAVEDAVHAHQRPKIEDYVDDQVYFPRANVVETENHLEMSLEIPGYDNEDVAIKMINSSLTIKGKRNLILFKKEQQYHRIEIPFRNSFLRRFELPTNVNQSQASWNVRLGVLYVYLPKLTTIKKAEVTKETMLA